jgi:ketosteroid isomerase-like protein
MEFIKSTYLRSLTVQIVCLMLLVPAGVASAGKIDDVRATVYAWCKAWQNRDIDTYMSFYSRNFRSKGLDYRGWMQKKKRRFNTAGEFRVDIFDLGVFIEGESAVARFIQRYQDPKMSDVGEKTLTMIQTGGKWNIVSEAWEPLKAPLRIIREPAPPSVPKNTKPPPSPVGDAKQHQTGNILSQRTILVKSIKFEPQKKLEKLFITSDKYFVPKISTVEGDHPKVVIDIKPVSSWNGPYITPTNGNLVRQIRTSLYPGSDTLRIVLDLNPSENYHINQIYYEKKNIYCLEIR